MRGGCMERRILYNTTRRDRVDRPIDAIMRPGRARDKGVRLPRSRVVDDHLDRAERRFGPVKDQGNGRRVRQVNLHRRDAPAAVMDRPYHVIGGERLPCMIKSLSRQAPPWRHVVAMGAGRVRREEAEIGAEHSGTFISERAG